MPFDHRPLTTDCLVQVIDCRLLFMDHWLPALGYWVLAFDR